jgi:DNA-binding response OmpR family regulator
MLHSDESNPPPKILLAFRDVESIHLLSIVLEGFGYSVVQCRDVHAAEQAIEDNTMTAVIVHLGLQDAQAICESSNLHDLPLLVLHENSKQDRPTWLDDMGKLELESEDAEPDQILGKLANLTHRR